MRRRMMSALLAASALLITAYLSKSSATLPGFLIPAVSIMTYFFPSLSNLISTESRVVPDIGETMTRSCPMILLAREDLPTLGLPNRAKVRAPSYVSTGFLGSFLMMSSSKSPKPKPCSEETAYGLSKPSL